MLRVHSLETWMHIFYGFLRLFYGLGKYDVFSKHYVFKIHFVFLRVFYGFSTGFLRVLDSSPKNPNLGNKNLTKPTKMQSSWGFHLYNSAPRSRKGHCVDIEIHIKLDKYSYTQNWGLHAMTLCSNCMGLKANQHGTTQSY